MWLSNLITKKPLIAQEDIVCYKWAKNHLSKDVIVKCTIPKGSEYAMGEFEFMDVRVKAYASNCIVYNEIVN